MSIDNIQNIQQSIIHLMPKTQKVFMHALKVASEDSKTPVITRALEKIIGIIEDLDSKTLLNIGSHSSNLDLVIKILENDSSVEKDSLDELHLKGIIAKRDLMKKEGGVMTAARVSEILGISRQAVDKRRRTGHLFAVSPGRRGYLYPAWQFIDNGVLPGFIDVLPELKHFDQWMIMIFMLNKNRYLGNKTPVQALRDGNTEEVLRAARLTKDQGAR